jgi:hypothetical protein
MTPVVPIRSDETVRSSVMSSVSSTKSASLPGVRLPRSRSSPAIHAASSV